MFDSFASNSRFEADGEWFDLFTGRSKWLEAEATINSAILEAGAEIVQL